MVKVEVVLPAAVSVAEVGTVQRRADGAVQVRETAPAKPFSEPRVTVPVPAEPEAMTRLGVTAPRVKSVGSPFAYGIPSRISSCVKPSA